MAEVAKAVAAELPSPDGHNWFQPWASLLTSVRSQTKQAIDPQFVHAESQVSHTSEEQISKAAERLDKWLDDCRKTLLGADSQPAPPAAAANLPMSSLISSTSPDDWSYYVADGGSDRLILHQRPSGPTTSQTRIIGLLVIVGLLIATLWIARWPAAKDFICRWPQAVGVSIGVACWAWLWPSWLGLVIIAASVWLALRFDWPGRSLRTEASTVLRTARPTQS